MQNTTCLNCNTPLTGKFCFECGQKADTHRITAKHFFMHDLLHGVFHIERGILFTLKQVVIRPGYSARDYISGKRVSYYNIFYLMVIILGVILFLDTYVETANSTAANTENAAPQHFNQLLDNYVKILYMAFVPLIAVNGLLFFRKLKYNFSEHLIISGFACLLMLVIVLFNIFFTIAFGNISFVDSIFGAICFLVPGLVYYQVSRGTVKLTGYLISMLLFYLVISAEVFAIAIVIKFLLKSFVL
jgi:hypothetical protein